MEMYHLNEDQVSVVLIQMEAIEQFHYERHSNLNGYVFLLLKQKLSFRLIP